MLTRSSRLERASRDQRPGSGDNSMPASHPLEYREDSEPPVGPAGQREAFGGAEEQMRLG